MQVHGPRSTVHGQQSKVAGQPKTHNARLAPAACGGGLPLAASCAPGSPWQLLVTGCAGPRPLKGGKATTTRNQAGLIQQTVAQGENASQPSKQDQETIKVRSYTLPAATRIEQAPVAGGAMTADGGQCGHQNIAAHPMKARLWTVDRGLWTAGIRPSDALNTQPSTDVRPQRSDAGD